MRDKFTKNFISHPQFLKGQLLIASPHIRDEVFGSSVIFVCTHDQEGALGLIINRPLETVTFMELMAQLDLKSAPEHADKMIYFGGPLDVNRGFILHEPLSMEQDPNSEEAFITEDISLSTNLKFFKAISGKEAIPLKNMLVAIGYAGWTKGQLENEIQSGDWISMPAERHLIFDTPPQDLWEKAYETLKVDPYKISDRVGFA
jgi:putative transcriptional regulator